VPEGRAAPACRRSRDVVVQIRPIAFTIGLLLCVIAAAMVLPAVVDIVDGNPDWQVFLASSVITIFFGVLLTLSAYTDEPIQVGLKDGFLLTTLSWIVVTAFGAVPFIGLGFSYTDAYFESMSGLTTTGSTVVSGLDKLPRGILLWRAILCGIGGLGIVVMAIIMMPFLRVGGMQLFQTESSDRSEKLMPRAFDLTVAIAGVYASLLLACGVLYVAFGMSVFDAICHALTTVATAGFSNHDTSFAYFKSAEIEVTAVVFMTLGALPLVIFIKAGQGNFFSVWRDVQVRGLLTCLTTVSLLVALWLTATRGLEPLAALRLAAFNVVSIVTTTGYSSADYTQWGPFAVGLFFLLGFIGGCSGSTSGSLKIYRLQIAGLLTRNHILHLMSPRRIVTLTYNGRRLPADVPFSVIAFLAVYLSTIGLFTVVLSALGLDFETALSGAASAICNLGPGLGDTIGPAGNFSSLPAAAKWVLAFGMLLGRLELFTVLVLLRAEFWRG
jgi:trk system potassium uptake protein TrkH